jgi:hypothetical protein
MEHCGSLIVPGVIVPSYPIFEKYIRFTLSRIILAPTDNAKTVSKNKELSRILTYKKGRAK